jgi:hypothetical protein
MTTSTEIAAAYKKYVAKQKQGRQRGWASEKQFTTDYDKYYKADYGPTGKRVTNESTLSVADRTRMLELAGMSHLVLTEAKRTTVKEDAAQSLEQQYGALGQAVADVLEIHKSTATDPDVAGEMSEIGGFDPRAMEGMIKDHINDALLDIFGSPEYRQLCAELSGQNAQVAAEPDQQTLDV